MAIKLKQGQRLNAGQSEQQEESYLGALGRNIVQGATKAAGSVASGFGLGNLADIAGSLTGTDPLILESFKQTKQRLPTSGETEQAIKSKLPESFQKEPEGIKEKAFQNVIGDLPFILLTGGLTAPAVATGLGRSAASSMAMAGAEEAGAGPIGQIAAGTLGGFGFDYIRRGGRIGNLRKLAESTRQADYAKADEVGAHLFGDAKNLRKNIAEEISDLSALPSKEHSAIIRKFRGIEEAIGGNKLNAKKALQFRKLLNREIRKPISDVERNYYSRMRDNLNSFLDDVAQKNPEFNVYKQADDLTMALKARSSIGRLLEENVGLKHLFKDPVAKGVLSLLAGQTVGYKAAAATLPLSLAARQISRAYDFVKRPTVVGWIKELAQAAVDDNKLQAASIIRKINTESENFEKESKIKVKQGKKLA